MTIPGPDGKLIVVYESQEANRYIEHLQAQLNFWKLHRTAP
jgi:nitrate reductase NapAB chaperone NapD